MSNSNSSAFHTGVGKDKESADDHCRSIQIDMLIRMMTVDGKLVCPHCGLEVRLNEEDTTLDHRTKVCMVCGFKWKSKKTNPKRCPDCGSYKWNQKAVRYICAKCNYSWAPRVNFGSPCRCPNCQSSHWMGNKPNKSKRAVVMPEPKSEGRYGSLNLDAICSMDEAIERCMNGESCTKVAIETGIPFFVLAGTMTQKTGDYKM